MQPKVYQLIERCVLEGITTGIYQYNKHLDHPVNVPPELQSDLVSGIMLELSEWFSFTDEELGIPPAK